MQPESSHHAQDSFVQGLGPYTEIPAVINPAWRVKPSWALVADADKIINPDLERFYAKQHLACIRMLFDWLVTGQVMPSNPAHSVRGPRHSVSKGVTPVLSSEEATALLTGMDVSTVVGLRDRAIIAVMTYTFARVGAVVALTVEDYFAQKKRWWLRLREKNGKVNEMPATTSWKLTWTPISKQRASRTTARGRCSAPPSAKPRN